ncbi:quinone-interacting membrane-bound oxidoreductase complex subunit QmoC [Acidobacteriota bacterium]
MASGKIKPDVAFIKKALARGGGDLKKCYQCATCSVVCQLSPDEKPFPRKEMIWAQWGLKDKLFSDPHVWLCHDCNDCSVHCPRGAKPSEVLSSLRNLAIEYYSKPRFLATMVLRPAYLPLLVLIPVLFIGIAVWLSADMDAASHHVHYGAMFPHAVLNSSFTLLALLAFVGVMIGAVKFWKAMNGREGGANPGRPVALSISGIVTTIKEIIVHNRFRKCGEQKSRAISHILAVAGFVGLLLTTVWAIVYLMFMPERYPLALWDPAKILGNLSAALLFIGVTIMIIKRLFLNKKQIGRGKYFDWYFLVVLFAISVTGIACEILRYTEIPSVAYPMYFVHLVLIFMLLIYAPYSKFAHVVYRAVAMLYTLCAERAEVPETAPAQLAQKELKEA